MKPACTRALAIAISIACCAWASSKAFSQNPTTQGAPTTTRPTELVVVDASESADAYYLRSCAMCPAALGSKGEAIDRTYGDRPLRFCCADCQARFEHDSKAGIARVDAIETADQLAYYPLDVSLIDGKSLGDQPLNFVWGNRLFRARDAAERERILADPATYIRRLDRAVIAAQSPVYGMPDKCPVQGDILPTDRKIDIVVANRMIRVCCGRCARVVQSRPYQYLGMVEYANRDAALRRESDGTRP